MSDARHATCTTCTHGYCAPLRCYCGHPTCTAYPSYIDPTTRPTPTPLSPTPEQYLDAQRRAKRTRLTPTPPPSTLNP